jgi:hypothetical protein
VPAERQQPRLVARDERLEGSLVPAAHERHEPLVRLQSEQGRASMEAGGAGVM